MENLLLVILVNVLVHPQSPLIVHYMSNSPVHTGPVDSFRIISFDLFNSA